MKTKTSILAVTKAFFILLVMCCCISCQSKWEKMGYDDYTDFTEQDFSKLKSPVILIGKSESMGQYNIVVKDSLGIIRAYGNQSFMANGIGESRMIGDTLK